MKVGTSSITRDTGEIDDGALVKLCAELADARADGHDVVLVCSGAIAAGLPVLGFATRPRDIGTLQAVGRGRASPGSWSAWARCSPPTASSRGRSCSPRTTSAHRSQYLHARETLARLLDLGVVPVVNENDTIADDEIRYGDNDRLAALVSHLVGADVLVLLTDTSGVFTADPRLDAGASLIEEIAEVDAALEAVAGGAGTARGSGGMASKLAAAKIAAWSGVRAVIAGAQRAGRRAARAHRRRVGGHGRAAPAAAAVEPQALDRVRARRVGPGGRRRRRPPGARGGRPVAAPGRRARRRGRVRPRGRGRGRRRRRGGRSPRAWPASTPAPCAGWPGRRTPDLPDGVPHEVVHRDDLVLLPD